MPSMHPTNRASVLRGEFSQDGTRVEFLQNGMSPIASTRALQVRTGILPPPTQMTKMPPLYKTLSMAQSMWLCDPQVGGWADIETYFTIPVKELDFMATEDHAMGSFNVLNPKQGSDAAGSAWVCSVLPWGLSPRALLICNTDRRGEPLGACCLPSANSNGTKAAVDLPLELLIRDRDSRVWGSLVPQGGDVYAIFQSRGQRVLNLFGNQTTGQLLAKLGDEVVAHAARSSEKMQFEIGVRTQMDPVLIVLCIMSVLVFNPEDMAVGSGQD